jgi:hypothetical protein
LLGVPLVVAGTLLLYQGLERYTGKTSSQLHNYFLVAGVTAVQAYFTFVRPSLLVRSINLELAVLAICSQCAWLMLRRVDPAIRSNARLVGAVLGAMGLVCLTRIIANLFVPPGAGLFAAGLSDVLGVMAQPTLFVGLTYSLLLMVNGRLLGLWIVTSPSADGLRRPYARARKNSPWRSGPHPTPSSSAA